MVEPQPRLSFPIVGIGASAGGLEAFSEFLESLPTESGMAFVLIQHLPPERESRLAEILSRKTSMTVLEVSDGLAIESNHVYVIRPGHVLTLREGHLHLHEPLGKPGHLHPVDEFFYSLAEEQRERAICIVMSGMDSNGSNGAQAVKAVGGLCIAQEPTSAKFPSMPKHLIERDLADFILKPGEMAAVLCHYRDHPYVNASASRNLQPDAYPSINDVLSLLRLRCRHDFSGYKKTTLLRRVERRMSLRRIVAIEDYVKEVRQNPIEMTALAEDLTIHVTGFFRDKNVWESLCTEVIGPLVSLRTEEGAIRAWVPACSSGEEAYTLAILLVEATAKTGVNFDIKVFATDTAERSLAQARAGAYPMGIEDDVSPERLAQFFEREDALFRVKKELRDLVVFAPQNILQDPPFSRLDICTCRNLLIYLEPETQKRVLSLIHFGLRDGGALLLGTSETLGMSEELFEPIVQRHGIFRRVGVMGHTEIAFPTLKPSVLRVHGDAAKVRELSPVSIAQLAHKALLDRYCPAAVVIDREWRIVFFHGDTQRFLNQPKGEPTRDLLALAHEPIRGPLRNAMQKAINRNLPASALGSWAKVAGERRRIEITASPLDARTEPLFFLVSFQERRETIRRQSHADGEPSERVRELEAEVDRLRDELQSSVQQLQLLTQEMKGSTEDAASVNEELQSTNEELETSKEELQSLNEELSTINAQLQTKIEEVEDTTNDLRSLLSSTNIAVVFLDTGLHIRRFTPAVKDLFDLISADVGRPLSAMAYKFVDENLLTDAQIVLDELVPLEREIVSKSGRTYVRRVLPYRTIDNRIDGVVVTFIDITDRKRAEIELRENEEHHRLILESIREYAIFMLDSSGVVVTWTPGAERILGFSTPEAVGQFFGNFLDPQDRNAGKAEKKMQEAREKNSVREESWHLRKDGSRFWGAGVLTALRDNSGELRGFVKVLRDNTDYKLNEAALKNAKRSSDQANEAKDHFLATVSHELRTPLASIILWAGLLKENKLTEPGQLSEAIDAIKSCAEEQHELIEDLVDTSRIVAGKMRLEIADTALTATVKAGVESVRPTAKEKGIELVESYDPTIGIVQADGARFRQVVTNLVNNAVKFTPQGGRVAVDLRRFGKDVEFSISDTGLGISAEHLPQIFNRFVQVENTSTRTQHGLGLGLAIAKQIIEMHSGTIWAESPGIGDGAKFSFRIPLPISGEDVMQKGTTNLRLEVTLKGLRVLLVEDVATTRRALTAILEQAGAEVSAVDSVPAAWEAFVQHHADIILSDLGLPGVDGYTFIRQIREAEKSAMARSVPALALTAFAGDTVNRKALDAGFNKCLAKPMDPALLISTLAEFAP